MRRRDDIERVSRKIQDISNENDFRVPYTPLPFSTKPLIEANPKVREYIERQEEELAKILGDCRERQRKHQKSRRERLVTVLDSLKQEFEESKQREIDRLEKWRREKQEQIKNAEERLKATFERKICTAIIKCLDEIADDPPLSAIRLREIPNTGYNWNDYQASFDRYGWSRIFAGRLAKSLEKSKTTFNQRQTATYKWEKAIDDFSSDFGYVISQKIEPIRDDSCWNQAKDNPNKPCRFHS